ncbi:MAG: hypothetical protein V3S69_05525 [Dehalococcoidales bacterium]
MGDLVPPANIESIVEVSARGSKGLAMFPQDQTTDSLDVPFLMALDTATLASATAVEDRFFTVDPGEGAKFTAGDIVEFANTTTFLQARVLSIATDTIKLDQPINHAYALGSTVFISTDNLLVDGRLVADGGTAGGPQVFSVLPLPAQAGDITRVIVTIRATAAMDSGTFGPIAAALTNGCVLRKKRQNGDCKNLIVWKDNGEFIAKCLDHAFLPNNGQGERLFVARRTWGGPSKQGVVQRVEGVRGEALELVVQDDLRLLTTATWVSFSIALQGHELQETL